MSAYLEINLYIKDENRPKAVEVYTKYKDEFLKTIKGATSKELLVRDENVAVLHGFDSVENAKAYLKTKLFNDDVATALSKLWFKDPDIRIYQVA